MFGGPRRELYWGCLMKFERIEQILGPELTNDITAKVLYAAGPAPHAAETYARERALCELLTALLALLLSRSSNNDRDRITALQARRLMTLVDEIGTLSDQTPNSVMSDHASH